MLSYPVLMRERERRIELADGELTRGGLESDRGSVLMMVATDRTDDARRILCCCCCC